MDGSSSPQRIEPNPFRAGFLQLVVVADRRAGRKTLRNTSSISTTNLCIFPQFFFPPGIKTTQPGKQHPKGLLKSN
jgi:hypothetical protein